MKKAVGYAALSCALGIAESKALKWSDEGGPRWHPAQETLAYMPSLGVAGVEAPTPTPPPHPAETRERLEARDTDKNTCGYISGIQSGLDRWSFVPGPWTKTNLLASVVALVRRQRALCVQFDKLSHRVLR